MKRHLLTLVAGTVVFPGMASAADPGFNQSISGNVQVQHTQTIDGDVATADNKLDDDDSYLNWNFNYAARNGDAADAFIRFQPNGEWRYGAIGSKRGGNWLTTAKVEWDADMARDDSGDGESEASEVYRDWFVRFDHDYGFYAQLGNRQYLDQIKGYDDSTGGELLAGQNGKEDVNTTIWGAKNYDQYAYFLTDEARFRALQLGYRTPVGLDVSLVMQMDNTENGGLFGVDTMKGANDDVYGNEANNTQDIRGSIFTLKYAEFGVDAILHILDGKVEPSDDRAGNNVTSDTKQEYSGLQFAAVYRGGYVDPFINYSSASLENTDDDGSATIYTTETDTSALNIGVSVPLRTADIYFSITETSYEFNDGNSATNGDDEKEKTGTAYQLQYQTDIAGADVKLGVGTGEFDDDEVEEDSDSYIALRIDYGF